MLGTLDVYVVHDGWRCVYYLKGKKYYDKQIWLDELHNMRYKDNTTTEKEMSKFKVGDRVRVIDAAYSADRLNVGDIHTVVEVDERGSVRFALEKMHWLDSRFELVSTNEDFDELRQLIDLLEMADACQHPAFIQHIKMINAKIDRIERGSK